MGWNACPSPCPSLRARFRREHGQGFSCCRVDGRLATVPRELEAIVGQLPIQSLPDVAAGLERIRWTGQLRLLATFESSDRPLLTVEQIGVRLGGVSKAQIYRLAKTNLRSAVVEIGEGTLGFDPARVDRFIELRRRG